MRLPYRYSIPLKLRRSLSSGNEAVGISTSSIPGEESQRPCRLALTCRAFST